MGGVAGVKREAHKKIHNLQPCTGAIPGILAETAAPPAMKWRQESKIRMGMFRENRDECQRSVRYRSAYPG